MEIISVLVVLFTTIVAIVVASYAYGMANIEEIRTNWVQYRCNPMYMPLAGMMGSDVASNFMNCTLQSVNTYAGFVMDPIYNNFGILTDTIKMILDSMNSMRAAVNGASGGFLMIVQSVLGKIQNTFQTVIQLIGRSRTIMNRMIASFAILMNIVSSGVQTGQSVANGPIGRAGQFLQHCFHPDTKIALTNNISIRIADIEAGDVLANGKKVKSTLVFDGMETPMFTIDGIVVSGNHKVLYNEKWIRVEHHPYAVQTYVCPRIYCLNVEGRQFSVGGHTFKDYEETDDPVILAEFFAMVQRSHGAYGYTSPLKFLTPLRYRFTGVAPQVLVLMENGSQKCAWDVQIGDRLLYGGSVIGRVVHDSVERLSLRGCMLALGTWIHHHSDGMYTHIGDSSRYYERGYVVQFLTETAKYAIMPPDQNEIIIADVRETTDPNPWRWRDAQVQKQGIL